MGRTLKDRKQTYGEVTAFPDRWYVPVAKLGATFMRESETRRVPRNRADQRSERGRGSAHRSYREM